MTFQRDMLIGRDGYPVPQGFSPTVFQVAQSRANAARRYQLNFVQNNVASGAQVTLQARPQVLFRPERLIVPSQIAPNFEIVDLLIGNRTQLVATANTSAEVFSEVAIGTGLLLDTAQPGIDVILVIQNVVGTTEDFRATFLGAVVSGAP
jgi:hypothetical protein